MLLRDIGILVAVWLSAVVAALAGTPHELQLKVKIPTENQGEYAETLHLMQQRVRASGQKGTAPLFMTMMPDGKHQYRLVVRGTRVPDLLEKALPMPTLMGLTAVTREDGAAAAAEGLLEVLGPGRARVEPMLLPDESMLDIATVSLTAAGAPCLLLRLEPLETSVVEAARRQLAGKLVGVGLAGRVGVTSLTGLPGSLHSLEVELAGDAEEAGAVLGLLKGADGPVPSTEMTVLAVEKAPMAEEGVGSDLDHVVAKLPTTLTQDTLREYVLQPQPVLKVVAMSRARSELSTLPESRVRHLLTDPEPGVAAAVLRLAATRYPTKFLISLLQDPRSVVRDAALEKLLRDDAAAAPEAIGALAGSDRLAWAAPILAARGVKAAAAALAAYVADGNRQFPHRQTALRSLIAIDPAHTMVAKVLKDEADPLWPTVGLTLAGVKGKVSLDALARLAQSSRSPAGDRVEAAMKIMGREKGRGKTLLRKLASSSDDVVRALARARLAANP